LKKLIKKRTERGFYYIEFKDEYNNECSIQKSSLATKDCIWFGKDDKRMHLSRIHVLKLLPTLIKFIITGNI
jgi:hypothetical protein